MTTMMKKKMENQVVGEWVQRELVANGGSGFTQCAAAAAAAVAATL